MNQNQTPFTDNLDKDKRKRIDGKFSTLKKKKKSRKLPIETVKDFLHLNKLHQI